MHLQNHLKTSNLSADNLKKILDLDESIPEPVMRAADTGQQISCFNIDYNMDVQYEVAPGLQAKLAKKYEFKHWFPYGALRTDGQRSVGVRSHDYQIFADE